MEGLGAAKPTSASWTQMAPGFDLKGCSALGIHNNAAKKELW